MLSSKTRIEFARPADVAAMARLSRDEIEYGLAWDYTPRKVARLRKDKSKNVVVARVGNELAGFGVMTYRNEQANLDLLAVKATFRRHRVGTQIVDWLNSVALTAGIYNVFVQVRASNAAALAFYRQLGFDRLDTLPGYYQGVENAAVLARALRPMMDARQPTPEFTARHRRGQAYE